MCPSSHGHTMSDYYAWHSPIYDATRWAFLFGRDAILNDLLLADGETVVEVGCGTGRNFENVLSRIGERGHLLAVDCAAPMIARCRRRIHANRWDNVQLLQAEYGLAPLTFGKADVVLFSYSLSMIPSWDQALECALKDLRPGGRIGVVDFYLEDRNRATLAFAAWMKRNHVVIDRPYLGHLSSVFRPVHRVTGKALGGLWSFYRFVGERR